MSNKEKPPAPPRVPEQIAEVYAEHKAEFPRDRRYEPTDKIRRQVRMLVFAGFNHETIAAILLISRKTLEAHYPFELETAKATGLGLVAANLFKLATKDDFRAIPAAIFVCKTQLGWREVQRHEIANADGLPFASATRDMTPVEAEQVYAAMLKNDVASGE